MTSLVKAIQERLAKKLDDAAKIYRSVPSELNVFAAIRAEECEQWAGILRDADLEEFERELTARLEAAEGELDKHHNLTAVERLQAISAMKTAHNFLQEHWSGNPDWKKGNEHLWIARADFELERGIEALAKDSYE